MAQNAACTLGNIAEICFFKDSGPFGAIDRHRCQKHGLTMFRLSCYSC